MLRDRITAASAGNPLYVEEMLAMVREHGGEGEIVVPPTIHALLQARIDSLDGDVRVVMERGSVEGEVFHRGAVAQLSPASGSRRRRRRISRRSCARSSSARPHRPSPRTRGTASAICSSAMRRTSRCRRRRERSCTSSSPTGSRRTIWSRGTRSSGTTSSRRIATGPSSIPGDPALPDLAGRAFRHLSNSGRAALDRGDYNAGRTLLRRAIAILPAGDERGHVLASDLAFAVWESGELAEVSAVLAEARVSRDPVTAAIATIIDNTIDFLTVGTTRAEDRAVELRRLDTCSRPRTMPKVSAFTGGAWRASPGCAAERQRRWSRASKGSGNPRAQEGSAELTTSSGWFGPHTCSDLHPSARQSNVSRRSTRRPATRSCSRPARRRHWAGSMR